MKTSETTHRHVTIKYNCDESEEAEKWINDNGYEIDYHHQPNCATPTSEDGTIIGIDWKPKSYSPANAESSYGRKEGNAL